MVADKLLLHEYAASGNCYKIRLTAALLGIPIARREYDILKGETRTPWFIEHVSADGRIPVLQVGDTLLPESNAACFYLAEGSQLVPDDRMERADMLRWMFWEQYHHEPNIATLRFWLAYVGEDKLDPGQCGQIAGKRAAGEAALARMDAQLADRRYFVGNRLSLADIALYAYTHVAGEGGFDLLGYRNIAGWLARVAAEPGHVAIHA